MIEKIIALVRELRSPLDTGCPWTRHQTWERLLPHTLEEIYELIEAVEQNDPEAVRGELADLLYHLSFYIEMATEKGYFDAESVAEVIFKKHEQRRPPKQTRQQLDYQQTNEYWEKQKIQVNNPSQMHSINTIAKTLPALIYAEKLQTRVERLGLKANQASSFREKITDHLQKLEQSPLQNEKTDVLTETVGELLFDCVNLARSHGVNPEFALRQANRRFKHRSNEALRRSDEPSTSRLKATSQQVNET